MSNPQYVSLMDQVILESDLDPKPIIYTVVGYTMHGAEQEVRLQCPSGKMFNVWRDSVLYLVHS
jgi:hypothetical protein